MKKQGMVLSALAVIFVLALGGVAHAATLGITSQPENSNPESCAGPMGVAAVVQQNSDPSTPYSVPGPGTITEWQTVSSDDAPGDPITFLVLKPAGTSYTVVGADTRAIPSPAPAVSSFTLSTSITVSGGETVGLWTDSPTATCFFHDGETPLGDNLRALNASSEPSVGQTLNQLGTDSPGGYTMNLAANFVPSAPAPTPPAPHKKKCKKKKKHKRSAELAKKKKCKKKKRKG
jgi:hypothetical protein